MIANRRKVISPLIKGILFFILFLLVVFFGAKKYLSEQEKRYQDKIYPNVFVDRINFGTRPKKDVVDFFDRKNKKLKNNIISVWYHDVPIATLSAEQLNLHYNSNAIVERAYLIGRSSHYPSRLYQQLLLLFRKGSLSINSNLEYDGSVLREYVGSLEERYNRPAKNALFTFQNGRVISFRQEERGLEINRDQFNQDFLAAINQINVDPKDKTITVRDRVIEPEITLSQANRFGIEELIAEGRSDFTHSIPERIHNIILATSKFHGVLIPKDKVFSFNDILGDVSSLTGYKPAYIIKNGKTVLGDGGGVCQVSTTLFRAVLNAGLPIIERIPHAYRVGYYENDSKPGFDATVFAPYADLKIQNNTPSDILIQTEIDKEKNLLFFRLYGKKDGRTVEISPAVLFDVQPPPAPLYQDDPILKRGVVKQVDFAAWGGKASFDYKVQRNNSVLFQKNFFSSYKPWQAVFLVGVAE